MARSKSLNDIDNQRMSLVRQISNKAYGEFQRRYPKEVENYNKNYKSKRARAAYEKAREDFSQTDFFKNLQSRANKVKVASWNYGENIRTSRAYKNLEKRIRQSENDYQKSNNMQDKISASNRISNLNYRLNNDKYTQKERMRGMLGNSNG